MISNSHLFEGTTNIYHYVFGYSSLQDILNSKKLMPINKLRFPDRLDQYGARLNGDADEYFEMIYNRFYSKSIGLPYKNYGIFMTPLDLFGLNINIKTIARFNIPFIRLTNAPLVIQVGSNVKLIKTKKDIFNISNIFSKKQIEKSINSSKLIFEKLPQIVYFGDNIKISKRDIEYNSK